MYPEEPELTKEEQEWLQLLDEELALPPLPPDFISNILARLGIPADAALIEDDTEPANALSSPETQVPLAKISEEAAERGLLRLYNTLTREKKVFHPGIPVPVSTTSINAVWPSYLKRAFDVIAASLLVLILSPLFVLLALLISIFSPEGPVFIIQERVGYKRRPLKMLKFRTMVPYAVPLPPALDAFDEARGPMFKIKKDPRITPIGRILRKMRLDELPLLFNVIKGDMSLVGPPPLEPQDVERLEEAVLQRRLSVKPGITWLWQVSDHSNVA